MVHSSGNYSRARYQLRALQILLVTGWSVLILGVMVVAVLLQLLGTAPVSGVETVQLLQELGYL